MKIIASATPLANIKQYFEQIGFSPNAAMILDNPSLMREFLRTGYGFAFVPQISWGTSFEEHSLLLRPVIDMPMKRFVYLEWQPDTYLSQHLKECITAISASFASIH